MPKNKYRPDAHAWMPRWALHALLSVPALLLLWCYVGLCIFSQAFLLCFCCALTHMYGLLAGPLCGASILAHINSIKKTSVFVKVKTRKVKVCEGGAEM